MIVGFDLDGIFITTPTFIPRRLIEWLYRGPQHNGPSYRFPTTAAEQKIRRWSHIYPLRPALKQNIRFLQSLTGYKQHQFYLITSRYEFLQNTTLKILDRYRLTPLFKKVCLNSDNEQPHLYKERLIKQLKIDLFIDDDLKLLLHLRSHCPNTTLLWYNPHQKTAPDGIGLIRNLREVEKLLS